MSENFGKGKVLYKSPGYDKAEQTFNEARRKVAKGKVGKGLGANNLSPKNYKSKELREQNKRIHEQYNK